MQVFLPYPDLEKSVKCLDPKRLGNQVYRECLTLIRGGWKNHPCAKMWKGLEGWLAVYALFGLEELEKRGKSYPHHVKTVQNILEQHSMGIVPPEWFGDERLHSSHRAALLYKNYEWYSKFGWKESPAIPDEKGRLPYFWPTP
jgi:hypothetical protein